MNESTLFMRLINLLAGLILFSQTISAQEPQRDSVPLKHIDTTINIVHADTALRINNLTPYFTQSIDSPNVYQFRINKNPADYYWYLENAPVGLTINKDDGRLRFKAAKNYFLSGKLKYDFPYKVGIGVQNFFNINDRKDTFFIISFYNTEIIPSRLKLSVSGPLTIDEGETVSFRVECETGSFPIENILFTSTVPIQNYKPVQSCNDEFSWTPNFDFVKDNAPNKEKTIELFFIGTTKFQAKDTASLQIVVKNSLNYPLAKESYELLNKNIRNYVLRLKYTFLQLDKKLKKVKSYRTSFDLTSASSALTGTILNTSGSSSTQKTGQILPSVGVALVPIKEAVAPTKAVEQNQASLLRSIIMRLEYMLADNALTGDKDNDIMVKTNKLKDELKQAQIQLIDVPLEITANISEESVNDYFNSPKVNKKYRLGGGKK